MTVAAPPVDPPRDPGVSSVSDVLAAYKRVVLKHPSLDRALTDVCLGIDPGMPPQIVLLLGPTGVGKTTLVEALERRPSSSDGRVVRVTCLPVSGRRGYDFGKMHWRLLAKAAGDPFRDDHVSPDLARDRLRSGRSRRDGLATTDEYRLGVLAMLRERGVRAVVLDESQHMTRVPSARSQADQLDVIKDCVDRTGIPHVLAGTYELSVMVALGDQLARRTLVVHFPPYRPSEAEDREAFQRIFGQLVNALPLPDPRRSWEALKGHVPDVYFGCAGCVGMLKDWLCRTLQSALESELQHVDWPLMDTCRWSDQDLYAVAEQIRAYRESKRPTRNEIKIALGLVPPKSDAGSKGRSSNGPKPGKRSPARDPVGLPSERAASQ